MTTRELTDVFYRQLALQRKSFGTDPTAMNLDDKLDYIRWNVLALEDELHEFLGELSWKPWQSERYINEYAAQKELIDCVHFLVNLCLAVGLTPEHLIEYYFDKAKLNEKRMNDGYTGTNKCPDCRRAYDDTHVLCTPEFGCTEVAPKETK